MLQPLLLSKKISDFWQGFSFRCFCSASLKAVKLHTQEQGTLIFYFTVLSKTVFLDYIISDESFFLDFDFF